MLTPQEVKSRAFQRASFGGYNMGQVDEFLDVLTEDYTALYNDNAVLKSKMKVLVDKVEEYRSTEEAMRKALMTAQRLADDLVREAETKKTQILAEAEDEARQRVVDLQRQVEDEEYRLRAAQEQTASFVEQMRALYTGQVQFLAKLEQLTPERPSQEPDAVEQAASEIDDSVQRLLAKAMADATAENVKTRAEEDTAAAEDLEDTAEFPPVGRPAREEKADRDENPYRLDDFSERTTRVDFGDLRFGKDYEIL